MLNYLKEESNKTLTENGALAYESTSSYCLDLFSLIGAIRHRDEKDIINIFMRAYTENPDYAMKILFFARDVREGLGERRVFKIILSHLANNYPQSILKNLTLIPEYGRFDDFLALMYTDLEEVMLNLLESNLNTDFANHNEAKPASLLAKWLPSINTSNPTSRKYARKIAKHLKLSLQDYRKGLSLLRKDIDIIENRLRERDYSFDYTKQSSRALFKYKQAFWKNDKDRYSEFLNKVDSGEARLNTKNISPYELISPYLFANKLANISEEEKKSLNTTWASLTDFTNDVNALAVLDTSGSMYGGKPVPIAVAMSLTLYFAERSKGIFKNNFIQFSNKARLIELKGESFVDKLHYLSTFDEIANTNLQAVFDLILNAAIKNEVPNDELPEMLILLSDMEFDYCVNNSDKTNFELAKEKYEKAGYTLPKIIFWNIASRNFHQPISSNEQGAALVSGCTPRLFSMITRGELNPYSFMMEVIESERYAKIVA